MHHFPLVYINLAKDEERRHRMQTQSAAMGLDVSRREAGWWDDLGVAEQERYYSAQLNAQQYFKPMANGEKGCYSSHIQAWQAQPLKKSTAYLLQGHHTVALPYGATAHGSSPLYR